MAWVLHVQGILSYDQMLWIVSTCVISQIMFLIVKKFVDTFCVIHFVRYTCVNYSYLKINGTKLKMSITLKTIYCDIRCCVLKKKKNIISFYQKHRGFDSRSVQTNDYIVGICTFSTNYAPLKRTSKDWLDLVRSGPHHHLIGN